MTSECLGHPYQVQHILPRSDRVFEYFCVPQKEALSYRAGQYAQLHTESGELLGVFSMASMPRSDGALSFHIHRGTLEAIREGMFVRITGPYGRSVLPEGQRHPVVWIAGGLGIAPCKAMIEAALAEGGWLGRLFWGASRLEDFYLHTFFESCAREHEGFDYVPMLSRPSAHFPGHVGSLPEYLASLAWGEVPVWCYASGPSGFVLRVFECLKPHLPQGSQCFSDWFDFLGTDSGTQA